MNRILDHHQIAPGFFHLVFESEEIATTARPGQFVMLRIFEHATDPLLRRPFSIMNVPSPNSVGIVYKVVGRGTRMLSEIHTGQSIDCLGPLGEGFKVPDSLVTACLIGGGVGIPPLVFLASRLKEDPGIDVIAFLGARSINDLILQKKFHDLGVDVHVSTDDGSLGTKGFVTDLFSTFYSARRPPGTVLYACGPEPMLKSTATCGKTHDIPTQVSMEKQMACGVGACLGCTVKTTSGTRQVCSDGPVFDARTILEWNNDL
jgi:dihydroorotate dehydrogenase electron transfer subunit